MPYTPPSNPANTPDATQAAAALAVTLTAGAAVIGGQLVAVGPDSKVYPTTGFTWLGVAGADAAAGDSVVIYFGGVHDLTSAGTITAGGQVIAASAGRVAPFTYYPANLDLVGVALTSATVGGTVRVAVR